MDYPLRAHFSEVQDQQHSISDRKLVKLLEKLGHCCNAVFALPQDAAGYHAINEVRAAEDAVNAALDRLSLIEKKSPA